MKAAVDLIVFPQEPMVVGLVQLVGTGRQQVQPVGTGSNRFGPVERIPLVAEVDMNTRMSVDRLLPLLLLLFLHLHLLLLRLPG